MANKTFYHSALAKEGEMEITITCDGPIASKFAGKPPFITFKYKGEEWYYPVENEGCGQALSGYKGRTINIFAEGGRDDAMITVLGSEVPNSHQRPPARPQTQHAPQAQRQPAPKPPRLTPEEKADAEAKAFSKMRATGARVAVLMESSFRLSLQMAAKLAKDFPESPFSPEDIEKIAVTHFFETKGYTDINALPTAYPEKPGTSSQPPARQPAPPPEPEPEEQEPEPEPDEESDDIPF